MRKLTITVVVIDTPGGLRYFSDGEYMTAAADTPARKSFESRLRGAIRWSRDISVILWGRGRATGGLGSIKLANYDGALDNLRFEALRHRRLWVYRVVQGAAWSTAVLQASALMERIEPASLAEMQIVTTDLLARLEVPIATLYTDSDDVPDQMVGRSRPIAIGNPLSCPVVLVDEVDYEYDVHDEANWLGVSVVRDQGFPITPGTGYLRAVGPGRYGIEKLFRAVGRVVADLQGATVEVAEVVGANPGDFDSGLTGWGSGTSGSATLTPSGGALVWFRNGLSAGTANITAGALTVGKPYLFSVTVTAHTSGSVQLVNGATVIGTCSKTGEFTFGFVATSTSWKLELPGSTGDANLTIDTVRLREVKVVSRLPDVVRFLAVTRGGLEESDIDWTSVNALDTACPYPLSVFADGSEQIRDLIDQVMDSFTGCAYEDRLGRLAVGRLQRTGAASAVATIKEARLVDGSAIKVRPDLAPGLSLTVAGARNWYRYNAGELADDASLDPLRPLLEADYRIRKTAGGTINPGVGGSVGAIRNDVLGSAIVAPGGGRPPPDVGIGTLLDAEADILAVANHIAALYPSTEDLPEFVDVEAFVETDALGLLDPFEELIMDFERFGDGRQGALYKIETDVGSQQALIGLWVAEDA